MFRDILAGLDGRGANSPARPSAIRGTRRCQCVDSHQRTWAHPHSVDGFESIRTSRDDNHARHHRFGHRCCPRADDVALTHPAWGPFRLVTQELGLQDVHSSARCTRCEFQCAVLTLFSHTPGDHAIHSSVRCSGCPFQCAVFRMSIAVRGVQDVHCSARYSHCSFEGSAGQRDRLIHQFSTDSEMTRGVEHRMQFICIEHGRDRGRAGADIL